MDGARLFFFTRLPYGRTTFLAGFVLHVRWFYLVYFLVQRRTVMQIGIVSFGDWRKLLALDQVQRKQMRQPRVESAARFDAIVANFSADLPPQWESFLANAALVGMIGYQVTPSAETLAGGWKSITGRRTASCRRFRQTATFI